MKVRRIAVSSGILALLMLASSALAGFLTPVKSSGGGEGLAVGDFNNDGRDGPVELQQWEQRHHQRAFERRRRHVSQVRQAQWHNG